MEEILKGFEVYLQSKGMMNEITRLYFVDCIDVATLATRYKISTERVEEIILSNSRVFLCWLISNEIMTKGYVTM